MTPSCRAPSRSCRPPSNRRRARARSPRPPRRPVPPPARPRRPRPSRRAAPRILRRPSRKSPRLPTRSSSRMAERFLTFRVGSELYALPAQQVAEIIRLPAVAHVPQAPRGLLGLANLRGNVLPVASLQGLLGGAATTETATRAIVLDGAAPVALAVDVVEALVIVDAEQIETRQAELAARPGEILKGAFATDGKKSVVKILDIAALISAAFVQDDRARPRRAQSGLDVRETTAGSTDDRQMLVSFDVAGQEYAFALDVVLEVLNA